MSPLLSAQDALKRNLWIETPLVFSPHISARLGCEAYLKLENLQTSHSFKFRGISHFIQHAFQKYGPDVHVVIASSENAGLAAAGTAKMLGLRCTVFITEGINQSVIASLRNDGAKAVIHGHYYPEALAQAQKVVEADEQAVTVPSYDDPLLWEGHASKPQACSLLL